MGCEMVLSCIYVRVYKGRDLLVGCVLVEIVDELKGKKIVIMAKREHFQQVLTTFRYNICFFLWCAWSWNHIFLMEAKILYFFFVISVLHVHRTTLWWYKRVGYKLIILILCMMMMKSWCWHVTTLYRRERCYTTRK